MPQKWLQVKGDPSIRCFLFQQSRVTQSSAERPGFFAFIPRFLGLHLVSFLLPFSEYANRVSSISTIPSRTFGFIPMINEDA